MSAPSVETQNGRVADALTHDEAVARARALVPRLRARSDETEALRSIPSTTIHELRESGLFGLATPRAWGGAELPPETWIQVIGELAAGCGSTAWVYGVLLGHFWLVSQFAYEAQQDVFGAPDNLVASLVRLGGSAPQRVEGGYRWRGASGRFCSGVDHAAWVVVGGAISDADGSPEARWFLIPRTDVCIDDDWYSVGLRGTGSKSIVVADAFIPEHRSILQSDLAAGCAPGRHVNQGSLYALPGSTWAFPLSATCLGLAREAVNVAREHLLNRFGTLSAQHLAEQSAVLANFAEAVSDIEVAHDLLLARARRLMESSATRSYTPFDRVQQRRDIVYAVHRARHAVNHLIELGGGSAVYDSMRIQQLWRDCNASAAHASFSWNAGLAEYGRALLGLPPATSDRFARA